MIFELVAIGERKNDANMMWNRASMLKTIMFNELHLYRRDGILWIANIIWFYAKYSMIYYIVYALLYISYPMDNGCEMNFNLYSALIYFNSWR